ncbi:MAG: dipeptidase [Chitinophagaceae bacterium]|nr:dipeptidase [Chitinophagaceae bacterium]
MAKKKYYCLLLGSLALCVTGVKAQQYQVLHEKAVVVDTHNDVLSSATMEGLSIEKNLAGKTHSDIARFKKGGIDIQVFSIFCDEKFGKDTAYKFANIEIDSLYAIVSRNPAKMMMVTSPAELEKAVEEKKLGCMMGVEGGHMIEDRLDYIDSLYHRGVRYLTLTWNNSTSWASSAKDESEKTLQQVGLNGWGKRAVKRMNELGMMVDLSHTGERTFYDALAVTAKPVLLSHSSVYTLCPVFRNLKDEQIKAVAKNGGVIQVNFYPGFLDANYNKRKQQITAQRTLEKDSLKQLNWGDKEIKEWVAGKNAKDFEAIRPPFSMILDHIDYIVKLAGVDHVGIGADMDGIESLPKGINGVQDYPKITKGLLERGYSEADILKILGGNFIRVFKANSE